MIIIIITTTKRESRNLSGESSAGYFRTASDRATYGDQTGRTTLSSPPFAIQYNCLAARTREAGSQPHTLGGSLQRSLVQYITKYLYVNAYVQT